MEKQKTSFSIVLIDSITRIVFWFFAAISAIFLVFVVLNLLGLSPQGLDVNVELPISFRVLEEGTFRLGDTVSSITISEASGKIKFTDAPRLITVALPLFILPLIASLLYILWLFKGFTRNVRQGKVFDSINISHFKRIAYALTGIWLYLQLSVTMYSLFIVNRFEFTSLQFSFSHGSFGGLLIFALFIWVLAHIFQKGAEIEEENRLTV